MALFAGLAFFYGVNNFRHLRTDELSSAVCSMPETTDISDMPPFVVHMGAVRLKVFPRARYRAAGLVMGAFRNHLFAYTDGNIISSESGLSPLRVPRPESNGWLVLVAPGGATLAFSERLRTGCYKNIFRTGRHLDWYAGQRAEGLPMQNMYFITADAGAYVKLRSLSSGDQVSVNGIIGEIWFYMRGRPLTANPTYYAPATPRGDVLFISGADDIKILRRAGHGWLYVFYAGAAAFAALFWWIVL